MKAWQFGADDKGESKEIPIPEELKDEVGLRREALLEKIAENDEKLMEKYFAEGALSAEEIRAGLKNALRQRNAFPVLVSDALANRGAEQLLDFVVAFAPLPEDAPPVTAKNGTLLKADKAGPFRRPRLQDHIRSLHRQDFVHPRFLRAPSSPTRSTTIPARSSKSAWPACS